MSSLLPDYISEFHPFIEELISISGKVICTYYNTNLDEKIKEDKSPVTIADQLAEKLIRKKINDVFPEHGIIGEEFGNEQIDSEFVWVIDPIDGTKSFLAGVPLFGTLIGLMHQNKPVLGVFHQPILNETMIGDGKKTFLNGRAVRCSSISSISESKLMTTDINNIKKYQNFDRFLKLNSQVKLTRTWGDSFGYYLLARGNVEIMLDPIVSMWDVIPIIPIIHGAGAKITDWTGNFPMNTKSVVATVPRITEEVLSLLNKES